MNDPTVDDSVAPNGSGDDDLRAAFGELRASAARLDTAAARRRVESAPARRPARLAPTLALAGLVIVASMGAVFAVVRDRSDEVTIAEAPDGSGDRSGESAETTANPLVGSSWSLVSGAPLVDGWPITITFEADALYGTAACNGFGGGYTLDGSPTTGALAVSEIGMDDVACQPTINASQDAFLAALDQADRFDLAANELTLSGPNHDDLVFARLEPVDTAAVTGRTWLLESYSAGGATTQAGGSSGFLELDPGGSLAAGTGCRSLAGRWVAAGHQLTVTDLAAEGDCAPALADQDSRVVSVLEAGFTVVVTGDRLVVTAPGNEQLTFQEAAPGEAPPEPSADEQVGFASDESLTWAVIGVTSDDPLNVRTGPGVSNEIVAELPPDETGLVAGNEVVDVGGEGWRQIHTDAFVEGWVNQRYLAASPSPFDDDDREAMAGVATAAIDWLTGVEGADGPDSWLSGTGLWLGGIGIYGDLPLEPQRIPASDLATRQGWTTELDFGPSYPQLACGSECTLSPLEFIKLPPPDRDRELLIDEVLLGGAEAGGTPATEYWNGPVAALDAMHQVTIDVPASSDEALDWQRIHLFFDWRTGEPRLHAIYTWGWTP